MARSKAFKSTMEGAMETIAVSAFLTERTGKGVPVFILGNPGTSKSAFVEIFAGLMGYEFLNIEIPSRSPEDILGYMTTPDKVDEEFIVASIITPDYWTKIDKWTKEGKKVILFFDELNTAPSHVQSAVLGLIQERRFKGIKLPDTVTMVAAGNYFENLNQDDMQPLAPVLNRFCILNINDTVSMSGEDDFTVMERRYNSIDDSDHQYSWAEAYLDVYSDKIQNINQKAMTGETVEEEYKRWQLEKLVCNEVLLTVRRLMDKDKKININDKRLSGLYSDSPAPNNDVYNFISKRTVDAVVQMAGGYYRMWGLNSLISDSFAAVINGLVGVAPEYSNVTTKSGTLSDVKFVLTGSEVFAAIRSACESFKLQSDDKIQKKLALFENFLKTAESQTSTEASKKKAISLSDTVFNDLKTYLSSFRSDVKDVQKPIEEKKVSKLFEYIINVPKSDDSYKFFPKEKGSGTPASTFTNYDPKEKLEYINGRFINDYKHWKEWWSVVNEFVNTFGQEGYGYRGILPETDAMKFSSRATHFFTVVKFSATIEAEIREKIDPSVKPFIENLTDDSISSDFSLDSKKQSYLFRNSTR
jgi:MoxR-like ATPase